MQALENSLNTKIEACTLKKDSADAIAYYSKKISQEMEEQLKIEKQRIEEEKKMLEKEFKDSEIIDSPT